MSGPNTKASKIDRILSRQNQANDFLECLLNSLRETHIADQATIKLLSETANRLEAENAKLRKYLGSVLFARRKLEALTAIPTLQRSKPNEQIASFTDKASHS